MEDVEWPPLVEAVRAKVNFSHAELERLLGIEAERVANAQAVAEALEPILRAQRAEGAPRPPVATAASVRSDVTAAAPMAPLIPPNRGGSPKGIADFIDEMLAGERRAKPPTANTRR